MTLALSATRHDAHAREGAELRKDGPAARVRGEGGRVSQRDERPAAVGYWTDLVALAPPDRGG